MEETKIEQIDYTATLTGEMLMFGLLGKILYQAPEAGWLQSLADEELFLELPFAAEQPEVMRGQAFLNEWTKKYQNGKIGECLEDINVDHTRLLVGIGTTPVVPWESVYFSDEHLLFQERTLDVRDWYQRFGLEIINKYHEPDDHIGLELAFMAHLATLGLTARESGDDKKFHFLLTMQREFLQKHLILWGPMWCDLMGENARTDFYRGLALVVKGALLEIARILNVKVPKAKKE
jgi:TorA maturation chaperone TorD